MAVDGPMLVQRQEFVSTTMSGMTQLVRRLALDSVVLAVHARHARPTTFPYTFWDLHTMVAAIFACTGPYAKFVPGR
ncbi:MAG TPA: hypothetical protein VJ914_35575 [Pseudonocardiaceae bacterium]|nr:hypothetical protein [Pseudonocardiaceae bacterium]